MLILGGTLFFWPMECLGNLLGNRSFISSRCLSRHFQSRTSTDAIFEGDTDNNNDKSQHNINVILKDFWATITAFDLIKGGATWCLNLPIFGIFSLSVFCSFCLTCQNGDVYFDCAGLEYVLGKTLFVWPMGYLGNMLGNRSFIRPLCFSRHLRSITSKDVIFEGD